MPEVEEADEVAVDDGGDAAFQREPEKKRRPRAEMKARTKKNPKLESEKVTAKR